MFLGIDTSCYTTSIAAADCHGNIIYQNRRLLDVPAGAKGLRQSEMVFMHIKNLPELAAGFSDVLAVCASARPRPVEGSYMPVFAVADGFGRIAAAAAGAEYYPLTHQHAHIAAARIGQPPMERFLALHVSGGTTDVLAVHMEGEVVAQIETLGSASDIAAGQLIDRTGQLLGLQFPCGPGLEALAGKEMRVIKSRAIGLCASFSGAENAARLLLEAGEPGEIVAASVQKCVAKTLEKLILRAREQTGIWDVLLFGGVLCNGYIRSFLSGRLHGGLYFAQKEYAADNACGLAAQAAHLYNRRKRNNG